MIDLCLTAFLCFYLALGTKRPFLWVLAYLYVDILAPQLISWGILSRIPTSLIFFVAAFSGWLFFDDKTDSRFTVRQGLLFLLLLYCGYTTMVADFPKEAAEKWSWVWKALVFSIFLPLTLRTRLRIEAALLVMVLAAGAIIIDGGIKTLAGGGGYGALRLFVDNNTGLYEGSIISCVAIAIIPAILWLARNGTIFPPDWRVWAFAAGLIFACALIPVGTQARTGLICLGVLCVLYLRTAKHRVLISAMMALAAMVAIPFLPKSYTDRMSTIENNQADQSASTRIAVWKWTLGYVGDHPFGGGFNVYLANNLRIETVQAQTAGSSTVVTKQVVEDGSRAFHSSYFEMLGEQGIPGLALWLTIQLSGLIQMEILRRRWGKRTGADEQWQAPLAVALQLAHIVYLVGSIFVGIAFQPFVLMLIGVQNGVWSYLRRIEPKAPARPAGARALQMKPMALPAD
jgi:probable O-glycosylation ligase (exosortase A-associated)